jgi:hypothetical protein
MSVMRCSPALSAASCRAEYGRINPAEFELFNFTYDSVEDAIKDRLLQLERAAEQERKTAALRRQANVPAGV